MRVPRSTYRLQVNANFRLSRVHELLDYFTALGISDLYLSPLLQARPGSTHGYDVVDATHVNSEIGSDHEFDQLSAALAQRGGGILLDIVPNHMAASEDNPWWRDVLEQGPASSYADFFDIDWSADPPGKGRLMLPVLGQDLRSCLRAREVQLTIDRNLPALTYFQRTLPLDPGSWPLVLEAFGRAAPAYREPLEAIAASAFDLPDRTELDRAKERRDRSAALAQQLSTILQQMLETTSREALCAAVDVERLMEIVDAQAYALTFWVPGGRQINYRRFFDISDLVGLRIELPHVFRAVHARTLPWLINGIVTGLRIDHIDGLRDPKAYLSQLHQQVRAPLASDPFVVVEKVLGGSERLPRDWCTAGTTGYDFVGILNGLFIDAGAWEKLGHDYTRRTGVSDFTTLLREKKKHVIGNLFPSELQSLVGLALRVLPRVSRPDLEMAIAELTACLPVYRTYITEREIADSDRQILKQTLEAVDRHGSDAPFAQLGRLLMQPSSRDELELVLQWQQFSGPVMAKGMEDTAFYNYHLLVSTCEVGADPSAPVVSVAEFHERMQERLNDWPATMNASSTHDTKRSEDVRARLNVLSELPDEWLSFADRWLGVNSTFQNDTADVKVPDTNVELLIYQTILGAWPLTDAAASDFEQRVRDYVLKAAREAKRHTSWRKQNRLYEEALLDFVTVLLHHHDFLQDLRALEAKTSFFGALNSLSQLVLKLGAPGIPDFYQGTELWALSLVDPDNRRPVDYDLRQRLLAQNIEVGDAMKNWRDGRIKLLVTSRGLACRNACPELFATGDYRAIQVRGKRARNLIAFERAAADRRVLFIAARFYSQLCSPEVWPSAADWSDTTLVFATEDGRLWRDLITDRRIPAAATLEAAELLAPLPFAILQLG